MTGRQGFSRRMAVVEEISDDARARSNVVRPAAAQALTGANSAVIFATGPIVGAILAPDTLLATAPLSMYVVGLSGITAMHFWATLVILGVGWDFDFVGASALVLDRSDC